jgi:glycosyltransferase involved in cell wall biosynthesis
MSVSVAMIVKNEERALGRCLDSIKGAVDEIVVVDTGSTDTTKEIARRYTSRVFDFPWIDDFAAARQFAFDQTIGDWVFWLDADDIVLNAELIRPLAASAPDDVGGFYWRYVLGRDARGEPTFEYWRERCVRNDGSFRWVGRVHEVLVGSSPRQIVQADGIVVEHHPPPGRVEESGRNLRILEKEYAETGGAMDPRHLFYLGREYADHGNHDRAIEILTEYLRVGQWDDERYSAQTKIAELYRIQGRYAEAIDADLQALKIYPRWPDAYFGLARSYYFLKDWPKVVHWTDIGRNLPMPETLLFRNPLDYSFNWIIYYTNAVFSLGDSLTAFAWSRRALEIAPDDAMHRHNLAFFATTVGPEELIPIEVSVANFPTYAIIPVHDQHELTLALLHQLALPSNRVIVIDNNSTVPARDALFGQTRVVEHANRNLSEIWNLGLDLVAAECPGPHNVAVLNNDLEIPPGFLDGLAAGLRARPDHLIAFPDAEGRLPPDVCFASGRMTGYAFMLRGEAGIRADPRFVWWYGDDDLARQARLRGKVVCVGGVGVRHLAGNVATSTNPELAAISAQDQQRFAAKWG